MRSSALALLLLTAPVLALQSAKVDAKTDQAVPALQRIAVIGASLTAGMGLDPSNPLASQLNLSKVVEASLKTAHDPVLQQGSLMFFMDPIGTAKGMVPAMKSAKPTLIVGVDYLFWFGYGSSLPNEADRLALLEKGLKTLEEWDCPILVGDFPDMSLALKVPQPILPADAVPSAETLKKLNERLRAWAASRKNVIVLPMAELTAKVVAGEEVRVRGNLWPKESMKALMQPDALHTTLEGTIAVWLMAVDRLLQAHKEIPATAFDLDVRSVLKQLDPNAVAQARPAPDAKAPAAKEPVPAGAGKKDTKPKEKSP